MKQKQQERRDYLSNSYLGWVGLQAKTIRKWPHLNALHQPNVRRAILTEQRRLRLQEEDYWSTMKMALRRFERTWPDLVNLHPYDHIPYQEGDEQNANWVMNWWDDAWLYDNYNWTQDDDAFM